MGAVWIGHVAGVQVHSVAACRRRSAARAQPAGCPRITTAHRGYQIICRTFCHCRRQAAAVPVGNVIALC